jgi:hypothetical protein
MRHLKTSYLGHSARCDGDGHLGIRTHHVRLVKIDKTEDDEED